VLVPPGKFTMGSTDPADNATPPRTVTITRGFYIAEDELSEAEYARIAKTSVPGGEARLPVANLSFDQANRFCGDAGLELPTEAEWEYACRAGSTTRFAFGDALLPRQGATAASAAGLQPCGFSERNAFGLADMHGNLREYCADGYLPPGEYAKLTDRDPQGKRGKEAVLRGGSFVSKPDLCTSAARRAVDRTKLLPDAGVRPILRLS
jgi:formylglycine-generating enzyme required for sulfatase activity